MDALSFALSRIDQPHRHHRHCVHNLSREEQLAMWRKDCERFGSPEEAYEVIYGNREPLVITPEDWEEDVPDLDWSRFG